jgi:hypothetical protein
LGPGAPRVQPGDDVAPVEVSFVVEVLESPPTMGVQAPRVRSVPPYVASRWGEARELVASCGLVLDEWQDGLLDVGLGVRDDGKWSAFEVAGVVARQNGKGAVIEARELAGLFVFGERLILHSAHEFGTSMEAFMRMEELLEGNAELSRQVLRVSRSHGSEGFTLRTGQRLRYRTRTKGGGRGFTGDLLILDEAMDLPEAFHGALLPTLSGRSVTGNPQVWYFGSAVDQTVHEHGVVLSRVRARGLAGDDPSLVYAEWSADVTPAEEDARVTPDDLTDEILADPQQWARANPGLGIRISEDHIGKEIRAMDARTFAVERLTVGDWPAPDEKSWMVIEQDAWVALTDEKSAMVDPVCLAFDVTPNRYRASIGVAGARTDGRAHLEVIEYRRGTGWLKERLVKLVERHHPFAVVCRSSSAAASFVPDLEEAGIQVVQVSVAEEAAACGRFFDVCQAQTVRHLGTGDLAGAVRGARSRPSGDAWVWSRKLSSSEVSPLQSCTLALHGWATMKPPPVSGWRGL